MKIGAAPKIAAENAAHDPSCICLETAPKIKNLKKKFHPRLYLAKFSRYYLFKA
jgi:hypothetical protein